MEENKNRGFGDAPEATVDYSVGAGVREEIRRYDYDQGAAAKKAESPDIQFTSPNNDIGNRPKYDYASSNNDVKKDQFGGYSSFNNDASKQQSQGYTSPNYNAYNSYSEPPEPPKKRRFGGSGSGKGKRVLSIILVVCICFAAGFGGGALAVKTLGPSSGGTHNIKIDASDAQSLNAASAIAKKAMPSVVGISTVSQTYTQGIFGLQQGTARGVGTGFIVSEDGYIITNSHVVNGASSITVDLYDGKEYRGDVLWNDEALDLAVVKIDAKGLTAVELGDSDKVEIGDYAVAIGNPLGLEFERSVTQGIISGLNRTITTTDGKTTNTMDDLIQTDASINSGNSGGPLLNSTGNVIGINTAKANSGEGMGFAIPINTVIPIIEEIKAAGTYEQPYLGITGYDLADIISSYQTDFKAKEGVYVSQIYTNSPAAKSGMAEGDIITSLGGKDVKDMTSLKKALVNYRPGDQVAVLVERNKSTVSLQITLGKSSDINQNVLQGGTSQSNAYTNPYGSGSPYYYGGGLDGLYGGIFGN